MTERTGRAPRANDLIAAAFLVAGKHFPELLAELSRARPAA